MGREAARRQVLKRFGATEQQIVELLAYNDNVFHTGGEIPPLPLQDEPHLDAWREYAAEAAEEGVVPALARRLVQLRFPIAEGISKSEAYIASTRKGRPPEGDHVLEMQSPDQIRLEIHPTPAGSIPLLIVPNRADFVCLVRAFSARNEPVGVPESMGACIVTGLNNWDRVRRYRKQWEREHPFELAGWPEEMKSLTQRKELYQDRFIILSTGPYSAVPAGEADFADDEEWRALSLRIRSDHECTHYFTLRVLGSMRNNLIDEIIADYVGLVETFGSYREDLALLFFGLERFPQYRKGARLENYRGTPPLSEGAFDVLTQLVYAAVHSLGRRERDAGGIGRDVIALAGLTLEELAAGGSTAPTAEPLPNEDHVEVPSTQDGVDEVAEALSSFARKHEIPAVLSAPMQLALDEVLSNIVKYGYDDDPGTHRMSVVLRGDPTMLEVQVTDDSRPFNMLAAKDPDTTASIRDKPIGGLGILLVKRLLDEQKYERHEGKNHLLMRKRLPASPS